ncbi:MAG: serine/threonine-protein kinase [Polyangiaceae bacterium]
MSKTETVVRPGPYTDPGIVTSLVPGQTIARYELVALIGRGGMGEVWEAVDADSDERVALKLIRDARASDALRRRFAREVRAASKVQHPAVVKVRDVIETDEGDPVMVMELLEGESLAARLQRDPELPVATAAGIMLPVVSAVGSAHAHGIVHRDLKPENIFLVRADDGALEIRVLDFGIAKLVADEEQGETVGGLTTTGSILGTPCYMAPEQVFGEKDVDHRVDVWAIGIILYQMLTGILPTKADNVGQVLKIIVTLGIWPLSEAAPDLPAQLTAMVDRMLSREREDRPDDLRDVQELLTELAGERSPSFGPPAPEREPLDPSQPGPTPAPTTEGTAVDPLADTAAATSHATTGTQVSEPRKRFWSWLAVAGVVVVVVAAQLGAEGGETSTPTETTGAAMTPAASAPDEVEPATHEDEPAVDEVEPAGPSASARVEPTSSPTVAEKRVAKPPTQPSHPPPAPRPPPAPSPEVTDEVPVPTPPPPGDVVDSLPPELR